MPQQDVSIEIGPFHFSHCSYDAENDVAYLSVEGPREAIVWESPEGHLVRLDPDTDELVGITILLLRERLVAGDLSFTFPEWVMPDASNMRQGWHSQVRVPRRALAPCCS
jgi:hypothetical protein